MYPTLWVGLGEEGREVVRAAAAPLQGTFPHLLPAVRTLGFHAAVRAAADERGVSIPAQAALSPQDVAAENLAFACEEPFEPWLNAQRDELVRRCRELMTAWLGAGNLRLVPEARTNGCDILLVASLSEALGAALALPLARFLRSLVAESFPGTSVRVEALLLLPQGACEEGRQVHDALQALTTAAQAEALPLDFVYLACPENLAGFRLELSELRAMCAEYLLVRTASGQLSETLRRDYAPGPRGAIGAMGLCVLEFPARELVERSSRHYARQLIEKGLCIPDPRPAAAHQEAEQFAAQKGLRPGGEDALLARLLRSRSSRGAGRLEEELTVGTFVFDETVLPRSRWGSALASYDAYFRFERFSRALARLRENARELRKELIAGVRGAVDAQLARSRDPANALSFLKRLNDILDKVRERLTAVGVARHPEEIAAGSDAALGARLRDLAAALAAVPDWAPIVLKGTLLTLLLAFPGQLALAKLAEAYVPAIPGSPFALALGAWALALPLAAIPVFFAAWRSIHNATERALQQAKDCVEFIEASYKTRLQQAARQELRNILDGLFFLTLDVKTLAEAHPNYAGENECRALEELREKVGGLAELLPAAEEAPRGQPWRFDATELAARPPTFHYKQVPDFADWPHEADRLVGQQDGLFRQWRQASRRDLLARAIAFAREGVKYILDVTLEQFARTALADKRDADWFDLYRRAYTASRPFVLVRPDRIEAPQWPTPLMEHHASNSLGQRLSQVNELKDAMRQPLDYPHPYELVFLQLAHGVAVDGLKALSIWARQSSASQGNASEEGRT